MTTILNKIDPANVLSAEELAPLMERKRQVQAELAANSACTWRLRSISGASSSALNTLVGAVVLREFAVVMLCSLSKLKCRWPEG